MISLRSWLLNSLPRRRRLFSRLRLGWLWEALVGFINRSPDPIGIRLHGFAAWINPGNPYPYILAEVPQFNAVLPALVRALHQHHQRGIILIDIGAAIGDTVLLLMERCRKAIDHVHCIEGDGDFADLLARNVAGFGCVSIHRAMLAREERNIGNLVRHHPGTATAAGPDGTRATTLDILLGSTLAGNCDLLKIDVDGSDGEVLMGAAHVLVDCQPAVIFEWHPKLARNLGNDPLIAFHVLRKAKYRLFLWFSNEGPFSHFTIEPQDAELVFFADHLVRINASNDRHYDVVALPPALEPLAPDIAAFTA